jgi:hypothetical protein
LVIPGSIGKTRSHQNSTIFPLSESFPTSTDRTPSHPMVSSLLQ